MRYTRMRATTALLATVALSASLVAGVAGSADAKALKPATTFTMTVHQDGTVVTPTKGAAIPNIDSVKSTIRAFYGATKGPDPANPAKTIYLPNLTSSPYATDVKAVEAALLAKLPTVDPTAHKAVVFDVDSTLLSDYANEEEMNYNYSSSLNAAWVTGHLFPAVPGMPDTLKTLASRGYDLYGITGRPASQESDTIANLTAQGFTADGTPTGTPLFDADNLYTKDVANQTWVNCSLDGNPACSTVEYKALTRQHIEQGTPAEDIVMNVGDQWSDLEGGYADAYTKLPNPTYLLPSADIPGAPASDASMVLPSTYTMKPDGSSGATATDGDAIPNEGAVVTEIRGYYNATSGIANKTTSPYITELKALTKKWKKKVATTCQRAARKHQKPAVVFDADDTTLWTYDMEDGAMGFNFDPALQNTWVMDKKFPATPGMKKVVKKAKKSGCTVIGLTGRTKSQKKATVKNLKKDGYVGFTKKNFYTKPNTGKPMPKYVKCATSTCTTIEFKSQTRKYLEKKKGFTIVANFGDQFSDLKGGHAKKKFKLPNPTYYLP